MMAQKRQKSAVFGLARAGAEVAAIAAQRKKAFSESALGPPDNRTNRVTSTGRSLVVRPPTSPMPASRRINLHPPVGQPESQTGKQPPKPLPRTVVKSESLSQTPQSVSMVLRSSLPRSQTMGPKQPPPPIAPKPALYQLKQKESSENSNRQRSSTLPQSWKVESQPYVSEVESDTKDMCGTSIGTEDELCHQHGMAIMSFTILGSYATV